MKRMYHKALALLLAVVTAFGTAIACSGHLQARSAGYDPDAAVAYAQAHWDDGVGQCDAFVEACLRTGGVIVTAGGCPALKNALVAGGYGTLHKLTASGNLYLFADNPGVVCAGDPLFFVCTDCGGLTSSAAWPHVALCGRGAGGYITDYAHNSAHNGATHRLWKDLQHTAHPGHSMEVYAFHMRTPSAAEDYTLTYDANGGIGAPAQQTGNGTLTLSAVQPTRTGYSFLGWAGSRRAVSAQYAPGAWFDLTADTTLYAVWQQTEAPVDPTEEPTEKPTVALRNYVFLKTVDYRATVTFTADVQNPDPDAQIRWFIDGMDAGTGGTYTVKEAVRSYTVQAKYMKDGAVLAESETETISVRSGFLARIIAFIRALFGTLPKQVQAVYDMDWLLKTF